jgi:LysM repeat protein
VQAGAGRTYVVRTGDTLSGIAAGFRTTWRALVALNGLHDCRHAGMTRG